MKTFTELVRDVRDVKYPEIVQKHEEIITRSDSLIEDINASKDLLQGAIDSANQVESDKQDIDNNKQVILETKSSIYDMKIAIDQSESSVKSSEKNVSEADKRLQDNVTKIDQSITAANILKHDINSSILAADDVNAYLMSTISKADNAQNALDLKVQQNKIALNDIVDDNIITIEQKAKSAGDNIDLKIAMANEARNSLSTIENSVLIASAASDKALLAYEQVKDVKISIDAVINEADSKLQVLSDATNTAISVNEALLHNTPLAQSTNDDLIQTLTNSATPIADFKSDLHILQSIDMQTIIDDAAQQFNRLSEVVPVARDLSSNTESAVIAAQNISQATTLGNTLLNLLKDENTQAEIYMQTISDTAIANLAAIDGINDADISALEV